MKYEKIQQILTFTMQFWSTLTGGHMSYSRVLLLSLKKLKNLQVLLNPTSGDWGTSCSPPTRQNSSPQKPRRRGEPKRERQHFHALLLNDLLQDPLHGPACVSQGDSGAALPLPHFLGSPITQGEFMTLFLVFVQVHFRI